MRTLSLLLLTALTAFGQGYASFRSPSFVVSLTAAGAPALTCSETPAISDITGGALQEFGQYTSLNNFCGQTNITSAMETNLCKVEFAMTKTTGTIAGNKFNVAIYTMDGANLGTLQGTSDQVTGSDAWSDTWVAFTFSTPVTLSASTPYAVVIYTDIVWDGNCGAIGRGFGSHAGAINWWKSDKSLGGGIGNQDAKFRVYFQVEQ